MSEVLGLLCARMGVKALRSAVYHPQGNAPIETFHRTLRKGIQQLALVGRRLPMKEVLDLVMFAYRATLHHGICDSPAYLLYGVDMRPPLDVDWRFIRDTTEKDRMAFLSQVRLEIMARAQWLPKRIGGNHRDLKFELGDLVLLRIPDKELASFARIEGSLKLVPKWTLPHRVVRVDSDGRVAKVKNLLTGVARNVSIREVHIENARFIEHPSTTVQAEEWDKVLEYELEKTVFNPEVRAVLMSEFWERLEDVYDRRKRHRSEQ